MERLPGTKRQRGIGTGTLGAFQLAVRSVPQPQDDGSWRWTYIVVEDTAEYAIYLYGKDEGTYSSWRLEVSSNDPGMPLDHFTWFAGEVESDESGGQRAEGGGKKMLEVVRAVATAMARQGGALRPSEVSSATARGRPQ